MIDTDLEFPGSGKCGMSPPPHFASNVKIVDATVTMNNRERIVKCRFSPPLSLTEQLDRDCILYLVLKLLIT